MTKPASSRSVPARLKNDPLDWMTPPPASNPEAVLPTPAVAQTTDQPAMTSPEPDMRNATVIPAAAVDALPVAARPLWENTSALGALDLLGSPIMIADTDMVIRHANPACGLMLGAMEAGLKRDLPTFRTQDLVGMKLDAFRMVQIRMKELVKTLASPHQGQFTAGTHVLGFRLTPGFDAAGVITMVMVELEDRTAITETLRQGDMLLHDLEAMAEAHALGGISHAIDAGKFGPALSPTVQRVNEMIQGHIKTNQKVLACVTAFALGNLDAPLDPLPGEQASINQAIDVIRGNFKAVISEIERLSTALVEGALDTSVEPHRFQGSFREVIQALERTFVSIKSVAAEVERLSNAIVNGNLDTPLQPENFNGAFRTVIETVDRAFAGLNGAFSLIGSQVKEVATAVAEMSKSAHSLASNAQIQSSSVDEVSASAEETDSQVKGNAASARSANLLAAGASVVAADGKDKITEMVSAMDGIRVSSQGIAKIIKVIDEIAFQTNLLALNAAVEAARAGQHGRGFAVVAHEVRNLAGRSAKAARETSDLIEDAGTRVQAGVQIANEASKSFVSLAGDIDKVTTLVREISTSSDEQSRGVAQINIAIGEVAKTALSTSQQAEQLASVVAQMLASTEAMAAEVGRFRLRKAIPKVAMPSLDQLPADLLLQLQQMVAAQMALTKSAVVHDAKANGKALRTSDRDERGFSNF